MAHDLGGFDLRIGQIGKDGVRRLDIQPLGIFVKRFGARFGHPGSSNTRTIPKKYHLSTRINEFAGRKSLSRRNS